MPVIVRFLLWLACTALTVTAVFLAVGFVLDSTTAIPPVAHAAPTVFGDGTASSTAVVSQPTNGATASASSTIPSAPPSPEATVAAAPTRAATPAPSATRTTAMPSAAHSPVSPSCQGGAGTHTVRSQGGQASIFFGAGAVCLVAASPAPGFTTQVTQSDPTTLVVTFTGNGHRSVITATVTPQPQASVRESSQ